MIIHTASDAGNVGPGLRVSDGAVLKARRRGHLPHQRRGTRGSRLALRRQLWRGRLGTLLYADGSGTLKATLVWTDPAPTTLPGAGLDDPTSVLVHDLDILLYGPGGTTFYPWTLNPADPSAPAVRTAGQSSR